MVAALAACAEAPRSRLPPSASDLPLLTSARPCESKGQFLERHQSKHVHTVPWGNGEEIRIPAAASPVSAQEAHFFDSRGLLVGSLFIFPDPLPLRPYPVLRKTLSELKPAMEFYLPGASIADGDQGHSGTLYVTGDEKSTTQYVTTGERRKPSLVMASIAIDPYVNLLAPYRPEFLTRLRRSSTGDATTPSLKNREAQEPFAALQEFAAGQTAQLGYCGERDYALAAEAYRKALAVGFTDKVWAAEAHHRLGLALEGQGRFEEARLEMEQSLALRPNAADVLNNLGTVYGKLGDVDKAIKTLEKAVSLRPNYPLARYNLAEAYETTNVKRAIAEYETYIALTEGIPEEAERVARARARVKALRR